MLHHNRCKVARLCKSQSGAKKCHIVFEWPLTQSFPDIKSKLRWEQRQYESSGSISPQHKRKGYTFENVKFM
jgi:hypothetical protein